MTPPIVFVSTRSRGVPLATELHAAFKRKRIHASMWSEASIESHRTASEEAVRQSNAAVIILTEEGLVVREGKGAPTQLGEIRAIRERIEHETHRGGSYPVFVVVAQNRDGVPSFSQLRNLMPAEASWLLDHVHGWAVRLDEGGFVDSETLERLAETIDEKLRHLAPPTDSTTENSVPAEPSSQPAGTAHSQSGTDVFISYSHEDQAFVTRLVSSLEAEGFSVWWDHTIPPGRTWDTFIANAIANAKCCVVVWSPNSLNSDWVKEEATLAKGKLLPVAIEGASPPMGFQRIQAANLSGWRGDPRHPQWQLLKREISELVGSANATRQQNARPPTGRSPFGLWTMGLVVASLGVALATAFILGYF